MRNNTRRALRATATVAGVAALAGTFAGTAFADSGLGGLGGSNDSYGDSDSSQSLDNLGGSNAFDEPGLGTFEMPSTGIGSRGMRTDGIPLLDALDGGDEDSDGDNMPQHPVDNEGGNFAKGISFLGHDSNASWGGGKSIGSRDFRTSGPFDDFGGGDFGDDSGSGSSGVHGDSIFSHNSRGTSSYNDGDDNDGDSWDSGDSDGLSGHHIKLPIG